MENIFGSFRQLRRSRIQGRGGGKPEDDRGKVLFGVLAFMMSESLVFMSFITAYIGLRLSTSPWQPPGVSGPKLSSETIITSVVLLSSSLVIYLAERALKRRKVNRFRWLWATTTAMGAYFLYGEVKDWLSEDFSLSTGAIGGTFYIITGFHGLHVFVGMLLQTIMLFRSFIRGNYDKGHYGVTAVSWFWHFVDAIWVIVFSIFFLWR